MPFKLLVFDWDGTLMDSEARIVACLQAVITDLALAVRDSRALRDIIGLGLREAIITLYPDVDDDFVESFIERYRYHFLSDNHQPALLFPGARDVLDTLHDSGYMLGIATGKGRIGLQRSLRETGCDNLFHVTRCADESFSKPHPQMLLDIMAVLDVEPSQTLMVGDTVYDMQMAQQAGTAALAVTYGVHDKDRLLSFNPLACLDDITQVPAWLAEGID
jgi:phosphoglycolate phosphatase